MSEAENPDHNSYIIMRDDNQITAGFAITCPLEMRIYGVLIEVTPDRFTYSKPFYVSVLKGKHFAKFKKHASNESWKSSATILDRANLSSLRVIAKETYPKSGKTHYKNQAYYLVADYGNNTHYLNSKFVKRWFSANLFWAFWDIDQAEHCHRNLMHILIVLMPASAASISMPTIKESAQQPSSDSAPRNDKGDFDIFG